MCDAIEATGALETARAEALEMVETAKAALPALRRPSRERWSSWPTASSTDARDGVA